MALQQHSSACQLNQSRLELYCQTHLLPSLSAVIRSRSELCIKAKMADAADMHISEGERNNQLYMHPCHCCTCRRALLLWVHCGSPGGWLNRFLPPSHMPALRLKVRHTCMRSEPAAAAALLAKQPVFRGGGVVRYGHILDVMTGYVYNSKAGTCWHPAVLSAHVLGVSHMVSRSVTPCPALQPSPWALGSLPSPRCCLSWRSRWVKVGAEGTGWQAQSICCSQAIIHPARTLVPA
jgi:hypothetical protein